MALFRRTGDAAYDALRMKYDWNSATPPPGYRYGVGRGAKPFITSMELTSVGGTAAGVFGSRAAIQADTEFLSEMDRVEEAMKTHSRRKRHREGDSGAEPSLPSTAGKAKLSLDDLMTITNGLVDGAKKPSASTQQPQAASVKGNSSAGDLPMESIQSNLFDSDIDVRLPVADFSQKALESSSVTADMLTKGELDAVLKFGSEEDPKTWITRSRVQHQLGHRKQAMKELESGCKRCGHKGAAIWLERMSHLNDQPEALRRVAEESVKAYGGSEELWLKVVDLSPFHKQVEWLQTALIQLPTSEALWLRLLREVPNPRDRKAIVRKCLETNEAAASQPTSSNGASSRHSNMSRLWGMLADLEPEVKGREILRAAAAARHPPALPILVERAWFEEKHLVIAYTAASGCSLEGASLVDSIRPILDSAHSNHLRIEMLRQAVFHEAASLHLTTRHGRTDEALHTSRLEWANLALMSLTERRRPLTALLMGLCLVLPEAVFASPSSSIARDAFQVDPTVIPATWITDLLGVLLQGSKVEDWTRVDVETLSGDVNVQERRRLEASLVMVWTAQLLLWKWSATNTVEDMSTWLHLLRSTISLVDSNHLVAPSKAATSTAIANNEEEEEELLGPGDRAPAPVVAQEHLGGVVWQLIQLSFGSLSGPPKCDRMTDIVLVATKALFERGAVETATLCVQSSTDVFGDDRSVVALARLEEHKRGHGEHSTDTVEALLRLRCQQPTSGSYVWKKWLIHLRACGKLTSVVAAEAVKRFPTDASLRLLHLRFESDTTAKTLSESQRTSHLRTLYRAALGENEDERSCRADPVVWAFAASFIESEGLVDPTAARRLLAEAMELFGPRRVVRNGIPMVTDMDDAMIAHLTPILEAAVAVELRYADANAAIAAIKPTLDKMTLHKPDALVALSIDLTPRATRGTAAGIAMRGNPNPGPLTRLAVARVYHAMKQYQKCVGLVFAAIHSSPRCGDAYGMLLALNSKQPGVYTECIVEELEKLPQHRGIAGAFATYLKTIDEGDVINFPQVVDAISHDATKAKPNSGPHWLYVSKQSNPAGNVTLSGFRQSTKDMLLAVAAKTELY
jgi:hypothetical protein